MAAERDHEIKVIIGLGNPGREFYNTRHNIGFRILDGLAEAHTAYWQDKGDMVITKVHHNDRAITLVKPQTFMNASGKIIPSLLKQGVKSENVLVVHDELELPFGELKYRFGGSARGHNGLRSIIEAIGKDFARLCFGIGRPKEGQEVSDYVLSPIEGDPAHIEYCIGEAVKKVGELIQSSRKEA